MSRLTGVEILKLKNYLDLFPEEEDLAKKVLRELRREWHPDTNKDVSAKEVFIHISKLYNREVVAGGISNPTYINAAGEDCTFKAVLKETLSFGHIYYSLGNAVLIEFSPSAIFLIDKFKENTGTVRSQVKSMGNDKYEFAIPKLYEIQDKDKLIVLLPKGFVPLSLFRKHCIEKEEYRAIFWVISRAFDLAMLFKTAGLFFNGTIIPLCFVDLENHRLIDYSAYLFATKDKLHALDPSQMSFYSLKALKAKTGDEGSNLNLIRKFGLSLVSPMALVSDLKNCTKFSNCPLAMRNFLLSGSSSSLLDEYKRWQTVISKESFGDVSFYKLLLSINSLLEHKDK